MFMILWLRSWDVICGVNDLQYFVVGKLKGGPSLCCLPWVGPQYSAIGVV